MYEQSPEDPDSKTADQMDEIELSGGTHPVAIYLKNLMLEKARARKEAALARRQQLEEMNESMF